MTPCNAQIQRVDWQTHQATLLAIRFEVFVREQQVPVELEVDEHDRSALHLLATVNEQAVATARMLANGHIGRMAVRKPWRGQGIGTSLLQTLLKEAQSLGLPQVHLNAQCTALGFYQRVDFVAEGPIFNDAGIPHQRMTRQR